ncbi:MAG TPA: LysM peptidoglycan-binding domain-containing protein, partial [Devosia sp.]|nr:LysM peptidoglycan-binding domain-containing protein [Devosia sp.]
MVTGAIAPTARSNLNQAMPSELTATPPANPAGIAAPVRASGPYVPAANVGGGAVVVEQAGAPLTTASIASRSLPPLPSANTTGTPVQAMPVQLQPQVGSPRTMPAQQIASAPRPAQPFPDNPVPRVVSSAASAVPVPSAPAPVVPEPSVAEAPGYRHTIESGESLYAIARRYDVTTDAIVRANGLSAPDQIFVGQKLLIPGRADLLAAAPAQDSAPSASNAPATDTVTTASIPDSPSAVVPAPPVRRTPVRVVAPRASTRSGAPVQLANTASPTPPAPATQPAASAFRWPVTGRVIVDFQASRRTGINIEAPDGAPVHSAENGTVIYVGNGVEGYGNLVLVRHANGFVSAYAHLKDVTVSKGATVNRGDQIGTVGMSGSVNRPQLHFELRQGATPVDPMPLLAS